jgi:cation:H+ antiporter
MLAMNVGLFVLGVAILAGGAESLVRGGARLAQAFRVSPLVIGLTVVAFGTSTPELVVSLAASFRGQSDIAVGNAVGSNIFNILGILGPAALLAPLTVQASVVRREVPIMILVSLALPLVAWNLVIGRAEGAALFAGLVAYTFFSYRTSRRETAATIKEFEEALPEPHPRGRVGVDLALVGLGLVLLGIGAQLVVTAAVTIARSVGLTERVIALTLVAAGTSMPEFATSVVAAVRKQTDIAVGNIVGSSIFNILCILGVSSMVSPLTVNPQLLRTDVVVMVAVAIATLPIVLSKHRISRVEGALLTVGLVVYFVFLVRSET